MLLGVRRRHLHASATTWPGDRLAEVESDDGSKRRVRKADGPITVEWIFTEAELVETSVVSVPAVPGAHIEGIRAALSAGPQFSDGDNTPKDIMTKLPVLATLLGLAATAGEDEVISAVETLKAKHAILESENAKLSTEVETFRTAKKKSDEDNFITTAITSGRITLGDESVWRTLYKANATEAAKLMGERKPGCATPVGVKSQAGNEVPDKAGSTPANGNDAELAAVNAAAAATGVDAPAALGFASKFGAKNPVKTTANALGVGKAG
jgi:hypothetical protein